MTDTDTDTDTLTQCFKNLTYAMFLKSREIKEHWLSSSDYKDKDGSNDNDNVCIVFGSVVIVIGSFIVVVGCVVVVIGSIVFCWICFVVFGSVVIEYYSTSWTTDPTTTKQIQQKSNGSNDNDNRSKDNVSKDNVSNYKECILQLWVTIRSFFIFASFSCCLYSLQQ